MFASFLAFLSQPLGRPRVAEKSRSGRIISHRSANGPSSTGTRTAASYGDAKVGGWGGGVVVFFSTSSGTKRASKLSIQLLLPSISCYFMKCS